MSLTTNLRNRNANPSKIRTSLLWGITKLLLSYAPRYKKNPYLSIFRVGSYLVHKVSHEQSWILFISTLSTFPLALSACSTPSRGEEIRLKRPPASVVLLVDKQIQADRPFNADCVLFDTHGEQLFDMEDEVTWNLDALSKGGNDELMFKSSGQHQIHCSVPKWSLSSIKAEVNVDPGPLTRVRTFVDRDVTIAGNPITISCAGEDALGNPVKLSSVKVLTAPGPAFIDDSDEDETSEILERTVTLTTQSKHMITCHVPGLPEEPVSVNVFPDVPDTAHMSVSPDRDIYSIGETVKANVLIQDRFGNTIHNKPISFSSNLQNGGPDEAEGVFILSNEGFIDITGTVLAETTGGSTEPLEAHQSIVVSDGGPEINCRFGSGTMRKIDLSKPYHFEGSTSHFSKTRHVSVNDQPAQLNPNGTFSVEVPTDFGIRFFRVDAENNLGQISSTVCTELHSQEFIPESSFLDNGVNLQLRPGFFYNATPINDDVRESREFSKIVVIANEVLNSAELSDFIGSKVIGQRVKGSQCLGISISGHCLAWRFHYTITPLFFKLSQSSKFNHWLTLKMRDDGYLEGDIRLGGSEGTLLLSGTLQSHIAIGIRKITGTAVFKPIVEDGHFDVDIQRLKLSLDEVGINFVLGLGWIDFLFESFVLSLASSFLDSLIENAIRDQIQKEVLGLLSSFLNELSFENVVNGLWVPNPIGEPIELSFGFQPKKVNVNAEQLDATAGMRFKSSAQHAIPSMGIAVPTTTSDTRDTRASSDSDATVSIHMGTVNQALHEFWRAGYFNFTIDDSSKFLELLPPDIRKEVEEVLGKLDFQLQMQAKLPPVLNIAEDGSMRLGIGSMRAGFNILIEGNNINLDFDVGAILRGKTVMDSESKSRFQIQLVGLDEVSILAPPDAVLLQPDQWANLEKALRAIVESELIDIINSILPQISIPSFQIPSSIEDIIGLSGAFYIQIEDFNGDPITQQLNIDGSFLLDEDS